MAGQEQIRAGRTPSDEVSADEQVGRADADSAQASDLDSQVDSILDEIDSVLEENAEEFVRSFVQKGGQ